MGTGTLGTKHRGWREENPLRRWRKSQGLSIMNASVILGCSVSAVQSWEYGVTDPNFDLLAKGTGLTKETLRRQWNQWMTKSPKSKAR